MNFIDSMLKFLGQKSVVISDSGSSNDLHWIKYADGTAKIYGTVDYNAGTGTVLAGTNNTVYYKSLSVLIPIALTSIDNIDTSLKGSAGTLTVGEVEGSVLNMVVTRFGNSNIGSGQVNLNIKGKWK
ncbi:hypothetical protein [Gallibacter intestinalis]|uniref:Uncharacterized protein n=1 Tax=Gallibacter intestinalis TaxID=2779356 RepID=A0ABR9QXV6_9FIRM|nr:hypothetical protein [Gallibacter intestinalis]MBE5035709.1 hypothetical protein [Gallibacter intestinalis]